MALTFPPPPRIHPAPVSPAVSGPLLPGPFLVWVALWMNLLAYIPLPTLLPIPGPVAQMMTQGSLWLALVLVLLANPAGVVRPNVLLSLLTLLAVLSTMASLHNEFLIPSMYRAGRLLVFVLILWLLTPWWGRRDLLLLRCHLTVLRAIMITVAIGAVLAPGAAFSYEGRLSGALWPIPPTQVAHYAAMLVGLTVVLWFCRGISGRTTAITVVLGGTALALTHTRTAMTGLIIGLLLAGGSLFVGHARVRRTSAVAGVVVVFVATTLGPLLREWAFRGQSAQEAGELTGRTKVWSVIFGMDRPPLQELFGSGLGNKSFGGLAIDSSWVAGYLEQGWVGVGVVVLILVSLLLFAIAHPRGPRRALALFIIVYCTVASFTETGLTDASPYILELVIAGSLLVAPRPEGRT